MSSNAITSSNALSSEKAVSDSTSFVELLLGHTVEFGMSRVSSGRVHEMQQLGYFGSSVGHVSGAEEIPELEGELVVFKVFLMPSFDCLFTVLLLKF